MPVTTHLAAIEATATYIASTALPVSARDPLRRDVRDVWVQALSATDSFDPDFILVTQAAARRSRMWAVHRVTGQVFSGLPVPGDLSWLEHARSMAAAS